MRSEPPARIDDLVHHQREREAEHELDRDGDHGDEHGDAEVGPPQRVGEDDAVVAQPDELRVAGVGQPVVEQRQPDRVQDRVGGDASITTNAGPASIQPSRALGLRAVGEARLARRRWLRRCGLLAGLVREGAS